MVFWILIGVMPIVILLAFEELAQLSWRYYLEDKQAKEQSLIVKWYSQCRRYMNKFRKNPLH